jgi:hypothetical protein
MLRVCRGFRVLCLGMFYRRPSRTCLEILTKSARVGPRVPRLADDASANAI